MYFLNLGVKGLILRIKPRAMERRRWPRSFHRSPPSFLGTRPWRPACPLRICRRSSSDVVRRTTFRLSVRNSVHVTYAERSIWKNSRWWACNTKWLAGRYSWHTAQIRPPVHRAGESFFLSKSSCHPSELAIVCRSYPFEVFHQVAHICYRHVLVVSNHSIGRTSEMSAHVPWWQCFNCSWLVSSDTSATRGVL